MHPAQERIFQAMAPEKKLRVAQMLYYSGRELKTAGLKAQNLDWTEKDQTLCVAETVEESARNNKNIELLLPAFELLSLFFNGFQL